MKRIKVLLLVIMIAFSYLEVKAIPTSGKYYSNETDYIQKIYNEAIVDKDGNSVGHIDVYVKKLLVNNEDKGYLYDIEPNKDVPTNNETLTSEELNDIGYMYLVKNGFPNKRPYDGLDKENYYVTQIAIWMYSCVVHGNSDGTKILNTLIDSNGNLLDNYNKNSETEAIVEAAYNLYKGAKKVHDDNVASPTSVNISLSAPNNDLVQSGQYLISPEITANITGATTYKVSVVGGGVPTDTNNNQKNTFNVNEKFKVMSNGLKDTRLKAIVTATISNDKIYKFVSSDTSHQALLFANIDSTPVTEQKEISFVFQANRIPFSIKDSETNQNIPGATLVVKDNNGRVVELTEDNFNKTNPWVSTNDSYELVLNPGEYMLEETIAPNGYARSKEPVTFKVNADGTVSKDIVIVNTKLKGVDISKYEATGEVNLPGATLEVRDMEGNLIDSWVTTEEAHHVVLEPGSYKLTESVPPEGYLRSESVIEFTVLDDGSVATPVFLRNELIPVPITGSTRSIIVASIAGILVITGTVMLIQSFRNRRKEDN